MRNLIGFTSAFLLVILSVSPATAQKDPPKVELFAEGGLSFLTGEAWQENIPAQQCLPISNVPCPAIQASSNTANLSSSFSKTGRLIAGARFRFTRHDAAEVSFSSSPNKLYLSASGVDPNTALPFAYTDTSFNRLKLASFNYVRYLWIGTRVQPFATVGIGFSHFSGPLSSPAVFQGLIGTSNGYPFAWNVGGGTDFVLMRHLALRFELRDYLETQPPPVRGMNQNIVPSGGLVFRFK